ncbi:MAG TPA: alpha-L-arabinofuranosidase C-terminal domain-containing protein [Puia sp.]
MPYRNILLVALLFLTTRLPAQTPATLTLHMNEAGAPVSPRLYGLMTEEINFSYDGGLYGELIRNRNFRDSSKVVAFWSTVQSPDAKCTISLDRKDPVNSALPVSLLFNIEKEGGKTAVSNEGYWGIPIRPSAIYQGSLYARWSGAEDQPLTISLESPDGKTVYASTQVKGLTTQWKKYTFSLTTTSNVQPTKDARFVISAVKQGSYWFSLVSLFPPTFKGRANGNRQDLMQLLADMHPAFLRFPGGNYLEGHMFSTRFDWKKTIGPIEQRPGHLSPWNYRSTDGLGLLEFLEWCEDLDMEPLLAVFAGYTLNRDYLEAGPFLQPFVDDALDEIEYVTGDVNTKWGAQRAKDGHPSPFKLKYIEIGNEDGFDMSGSYEGRYAQFYDAIKAKYPALQIISTVGGKDFLGARFPAPKGRTEIVDEHYYRNAWQMEENAKQYDSYDRNGPKVFVGEWATREGYPTTNFNSALGDAAWMTGMERNSDLVIMASYAPLFVNVNPGGMQWRSDLIGYDALTSFGSPSYYAQKLFSTHIGDSVVRITSENIPAQRQKLTAKDSAAGAQPKTIDALFFVATRDSRKGRVYIKMVNAQANPQPVRIDLEGSTKVARSGTEWVLKADSPEDTNTITQPDKIVPVQSAIKGLGKSFTRTLPPWSITVLEVDAR